MNARPLLAALAALVLSCPASAEDGYDLWLRFAAPAGDVAPGAEIAAPDEEVTPILATARAELARGLAGLFGAHTPRSEALPRDAAMLLGTARSATIAKLGLPLDTLGAEGYVIRSLQLGGRPTTVIAGKTDAGALYGVFHFLRLIQTAQSLGELDVASQPKTRVRLLNHWDNLDQHVERGYAGQSIWNWHKLPGWLDPRYTDYARACASIGINGTVLTNVNANATSLTPAYIEKVKALSSVMRPYGIRVYLTARFSAPIELGGLKTADPLNPAVRAWWKAKADEIYAAIPDFGGFLV
jgi:alpha-glucuronidase